MSSEAAGRSATRILVVLDSFRGSRTVLELAVTLAARQRAELEALFVEDLDLVNVASLPFIQEVDLVSARTRPFAESDLQRALRMQTQQVQRELQHMAERSQVAWRMRVARGRLLDTALAAVDVDMLLVARPGGGLAGFGLPREGAERRRAGRARQRLCVLYDGSEAARRALALGDVIAAEQGMHVAVAVMHEGASVGPLEDQVGTRPRTPHELLMVAGDAPLPPSLACGLLLVPSKVGAAAQALLTSVRCPVLLVS